ncbi:hypothetical protein DGWBC_1639 [Dehalogenimonas sp. WBC-2]|nr:hypothetical protein DGWBC_1639 [Dehalogenimonas sp. WBC-2]
MLIDDIKAIIAAIPARIEERNNLYSFGFIVAERKAFLSTRKLTYMAMFRLNEIEKELQYSEMLKETGSGLSSSESGTSPGLGFKMEKYKATTGARKGGITEQSMLFGKRYNYNFDYSKLRTQIEDAVKKAGYSFKYHVMPLT